MDGPATRKTKQNKTQAADFPSGRPVRMRGKQRKKKQRIPCEECFAFFWNADSSEFIAKDELEDDDDDDVVCDGGKKKTQDWTVGASAR